MTERNADGDVEVPDPEGVDVVTDLSQLTAESPLLTLFGPHAKTKILHVLLAAPEPLNPDRIVERAGLGSSTTWYRHRDDLLATGLVEQTGMAGNSPLYALTDDDPRVEALQEVYDLTFAALREDG